MRPALAEPQRFRHIAASGMLFQGGAAAIDTGTLIAALVEGLTGSAFAVGAAAAIARAGWLMPQLFVGYAAQRRARRMPFYSAGAFGRAVCLAVLAGVLASTTELPSGAVLAVFFALWTVYAFVGGIVAVPYNDIVARAVPSERRSRLLAVRFFGGGLLALGVAAAPHRLLAELPLASAYAAIVFLGAVLFLLSAVSFVSGGEPPVPEDISRVSGLRSYLSDGVAVFRKDRRFRLFLYAQWLSGVAAMAFPFYVIEATGSPDAAARVALFLGAQTAGALLSNPLWGWWGDRYGKRSLLEAVAALGAGAPLLTLIWTAIGTGWPGIVVPWFATVFFLLGAVGNGATIAQLGYLMEISPDERRPAYSGYFNALAAPATLLPLAGAAVAQTISFAALFAASLAASLLQFLAVRRLRARMTVHDR
jgi:MFS family permease